MKLTGIWPCKACSINPIPRAQEAIEMFLTENGHDRVWGAEAKVSCVCVCITVTAHGEGTEETGAEADTLRDKCRNGVRDRPQV